MGRFSPRRAQTLRCRPREREDPKPQAAVWSTLAVPSHLDDISLTAMGWGRGRLVAPTFPFEPQWTSRVAKACRADMEACLNFLAARFASECSISATLITKRAQGMPGAGRTHGPPAEKKAGGSHHGSAETSRHSPRDGFTAYFALSPGTGSLAPVIGAMREHRCPTWLQHREARTTRLDRAHQAVRPHEDHAAAPTRPPHPALNVRDGRETPPHVRRDTEIKS